MDEKTKLYVFKRSEIFIIFVFIIVVAIITFILGVKIGKQYSIEKAGITHQDIKRVELMSAQEEHGAQVTKEVPKELDEEAKHKLDEFNKEQLNHEIDKSKSDHPAAEQKEKGAAVSEGAPATHEESAGSVESLTGKFTIQLHATKIKAEADHFASGFQQLGYTPIIKEVQLESGLWYRIYLGVFNTSADAKDFMVKNSSLFKGRDYLIKQFE